MTLRSSLWELGVVRAANQRVIGGERRQLVDGPPHHVDGGEVAGGHRPEHGGEQSQPVADAQPDAKVAPAVAPGWHRGGAVWELGLYRNLDPVRPQEVGEGLAVPELLVHPAREEGSDLRVGGHPGREKVAEVDHRMRLDVHHVVKAHHVAVAQDVIRDGSPVDPAEVHLLRIAQIPVEVELDDCRLCHQHLPTPPQCAWIIGCHSRRLVRSGIVG